jgi:hypothetical protein
VGSESQQRGGAPFVGASIALALAAPLVLLPPLARAQSSAGATSSPGEVAGAVSSTAASGAPLAPADPSASGNSTPAAAPAAVPVGGLSASASPRPPGPNDVTTLIPQAELAIADSFHPPPTEPRENFVPDLLRAPDVAVDFDISLLLRVSPRENTGTIPGATAQGFRTESPRMPVGSGGVLGGVGGGMSIVWLNRFIFPAISVDLTHSLGSRARLLSGSGGAVLATETWTTYQLGTTLLGVGFRARHRHWQGSLLLEPGFVVQLTTIRASVYDGEASARAQALSPRLMVTAVGCRRVDPTFRVCLSASPHVYALGFGNGVTFGFRTEIGP